MSNFVKTEFEMVILEVDKKALEKKLIKLGAKKEGDYFQKRYIYDFKPVDKNKWIRLRTNGVKSTITIKNLVNENIIGGTEELEIEVSDFDKTNVILEELGYSHRNYQENKRTTYIFNNISIDIDTWPLIPTYAEIEGKNEEDVKEFIKLLDIDESKLTTLGVSSIYREKYNIEVNKIDILKFPE